MNPNKAFGRTALIVYVVSIFIALIWANRELRMQSSQNKQLIEALEESVRFERGKNNEHIARISILETENAEQFLNLKLKDEDLIELQKEVQRYKKELKEQGSVTKIITEAKYDTIWEFKPPSGDTIILSESILMDSLKTEWIDVTFGFVKGNSVFYLNKFRNEYSIAIGRESQGWLKKSKPFVEVTSYNPYTEVKSLRTYQVSLPRGKRWGIGIQAGYGLLLNNNRINTQPYIGLGLNYNIITWD